MSDLEDLGLSAASLNAMKTMVSSSREKAAYLAQDDTCLGGLVLVLSNVNTDIVEVSLQTLHTIAQYPENRLRLQNFIGLMQSLQSVTEEHSNQLIRELAQKTFDLLRVSHHEHIQSQSSHSQPAPLRDTANTSHDINTRPPQKPKRRNSFFVGGGIGKNKMVTLQIRGLQDRDDLDICRNRLLTVRGVISITFDFKTKRVFLRTKPDLKPEFLAQAVARTMTMSAEQVVKDERGNEVFVSFRNNLADKENEEMPDYPSDQDSPIKGDNNVARLGQTANSHSTWGILKSVGSFVQKSLYW